MKRRTFDILVAWAGALLTVVLLGAAGFAYWGYSFANTEVTTQLTAQQIYFPEEGSPQLDDPRVKPYLAKYAGQQLVTGEQAKAYADHFIAVHISDMADGKTYAELGALVRANPDDTELAQTRETVFKGQTLRGMLLNAFAFWKIGQLSLMGAIAAFVAAAVMSVLTVLGFRHARRVSVEEEVFPPKIAVVKQAA